MKTDKNRLKLNTDIIENIHSQVSISSLIKELSFLPDTKITHISQAVLNSILREKFKDFNTQQLNTRIASHINGSISTESVLSDITQNFDYFQCMIDIAETFLVKQNDKLHFDYHYADLWRQFTKKIDENLVVAIGYYLDDRKCLKGKRNNFNWDYCMEHNNHELSCILKRGVSENHFHLRGSSAIWEISWIHLMNGFDNRDFIKKIQSIEENKLLETRGNLRDEPYQLIWYKAAAIRLYLYCAVNELCVVLDDFHITKDKLPPQFKGKGNAFPLSQFRGEFCNTPKGKKEYQKIAIDSLYKWIYKNILLQYNVSILSSEMHKLTQAIDQLRIKNRNKEIIDYAQLNNNHEKYGVISGERGILYHSIKWIVEHAQQCDRIKNLLFLYTLMKHRFRIELIQTNDLSGFNNFLRYQNRKGYFIPWNYAMEQIMATDTIFSALETEHMQSLEMRITPSEDIKEALDDINCYIRAIDSVKEHLKNEPIENSCRFYFVYHFIKESVDKPKVSACRFSELRATVEKRSNILCKLRVNPRYSRYILGIDASGDEMYCRPENFAPIFRKLRFYEERDGYNSHIKQLCCTYHVGEDNFDLLDGLRAIDETILFLDYRQGERLGHATALGVSPIDYYKNVHNPISMPVEIFIDNLVWLIKYIEHHQVSVDGYAKIYNYVLQKFNLYFSEIYNNVVFENELLFASNLYYEAGGQALLEDYADSWLLRGDDPSLYKNPRVLKANSVWEEYKFGKGDYRISEARKNIKARILYHLYHFNQGVKKRAQFAINESLPQYIVTAIKAVQEHMRHQIALKGIAIESNPTSNVFIGPIQNYFEHPISIFYDNGLKSNPSDVQLNVSINTDDKSIFSTCLSNEYAYLAFDLEHAKNSDDSYMYRHEDVFNWINIIRIKGNEQSFATK